MSAAEPSASHTGADGPISPLRSLNTKVALAVLLGVGLLSVSARTLAEVSLTPYLDEATRRTALEPWTPWLLLLTLLSAALAVGLLSFFVVRPIKALRRALHRHARGEELALPSFPGADEICGLVRALNQVLAAHAESKERIKAIVSAAGDGIVSYDNTGLLLSFNQAASRIFQYESGEVLGKPIGLLLPHPDDASTVQEVPTDEARILGIEKAVMGRRKDGTLFPMQVAIRKIRHVWERTGASQAAYTAILKDVTESKRAQEELAQAKEAAEQACQQATEANRAKSDFLSRMSHELRTPLNAILGFAQLLECEQLKPTQQESVRMILQGARHLLTLINEVLEISRGESGGSNLAPEAVPVGEILQQLLDLVRALADQHQIRLRLEQSLECGCSVWANRQQLNQVLLNLLSNAIKYNRPGGQVTVSCSVSTSPAASTQAQRLQMIIQDTGIGIAPEKVSRLFVPFDRLGAELTGVEGTGLGLALARRLVEAMGGSLVLTSQLNQGTTCVVDLPRVAEAPPLLPPPEEERPSVPASPAENHLILYIEDNPINLRLVEQILLRQPGMQLLTATLGRLGVEMAQLHLPELVLLDVHLPDMLGDEVLQLLQSDPRTRHIPVVVISADATPAQIDRMTAAGVRDYLTKPMNLDRFLQVIKTILHAR